MVDAAIEVHRTFGPGLVERIYQSSLARELEVRGLRVEREVAVPVSYRGEPLDAAFRIDLRVEDHVIVEVKAVEALLDVHVAQLDTYLKLSGAAVGLLINFNVPLVKAGIRRRIRKT